MDFEEWLRSFKTDKIKPVYIIAAQDYFLTRRVVERIKESLWGEIGGETNYQRLDGAEIRLVELLEAVNTVPLLGGRRLVVLEEAHQFSDRLGPKEGDALHNYLSSPSPTSTLMMIFDATDRRKWASRYLRWTRVISEQGEFVDCRQIYENQIPAWVRRIAGYKDIKLSGDALEYLCDHLSTDLQSIYSEVEKLEVHAARGRVLTLEEVKSLVGDRRQSDIFAFQHYLGEGQLASALLMLDKLLAEGEEGPKILNSMFQYYRRLLLIKDLDERGQSTAANVSKITNIRYGKTNQRFIEGSRRLSREALLGVFPRLLQADVEIKTGGPRAEQVLPPLVAQLCSGS